MSRTSCRFGFYLRLPLNWRVNCGSPCFFALRPGPFFGFSANNPLRPISKYALPLLSITNKLMQNQRSTIYYFLIHPNDDESTTMANALRPLKSVLAQNWRKNQRKFTTNKNVLLLNCTRSHVLWCLPQRMAFAHAGCVRVATTGTLTLTFLKMSKCHLSAS